MKTIKEIADLCGVSKTTIQRNVKELGLTAITYKNKFVFDDETAQQIIKYTMPSLFDNLETTTEVHQNDTEQNTTEKIDTKIEGGAKFASETAAERNESQQLIELLGKQLEEKDKLIKDLSNKIDMQLEIINRQSQNIAYLSKAIEDKEKAEETVEEEQQQQQSKKGFFSRLFGL